MRKLILLFLLTLPIFFLAGQVNAVGPTWFGCAKWDATQQPNTQQDKNCKKNNPDSVAWKFVCKKGADDQPACGTPGSGYEKKGECGSQCDPNGSGKLLSYCEWWACQPTTPSNAGPCGADRQSPDLGKDCTTCIANNEPNLTSTIRSFDHTKFDGCSPQQIVNYWCNGGVSQGAIANCNAEKAKCSACSTSGGGGSGGTGGNPPGGSSASQLGVIAGHVVDQNGVALKDINVEVWNDRGAHRPAVTDQDGEFNTSKNFLEASRGYAVRIPRTQPNNKLVTKIETTTADYVWDANNRRNVPLGSESYEFQYFGNNDCAGPDTNPNNTGRCDFKITLTDSTQVIAGIVRDGQGRGVPAVKVWVSDPTSQTGYRGGSFRSATTGTNGSYEVTVSRANYWVRIPGESVAVLDGQTDGESNLRIFQPGSGSRAYESQPAGAGCGRQCNFTVQLLPSPPPVTTVAFRTAENPADLDKANWQDYTADGMIVPFEFKDASPGVKSVFIQYKDSNEKVGCGGNKTYCSLQITLLGAEPKITNCSLGSEGSNAVLTLTGINFGPDKGIVVSQDGQTTLQIKNWKDTNTKDSNLNKIYEVTAVWPNAPAGQTLSVTLTNTLGQAAPGACNSLSQLALGAKVFCRQPFSHKTDNVELILVEADKGGKKVTQQKISIDKDGVIMGLSKKLEEGKKYTLSIKAPKSIRRSVTFIAGDGTTNIPNFALPVGDIFPVEGGDSRINVNDRAELNRQWLISGDTQNRSGDFNQDFRVNSIDYACMRVSMPDSIRGEDTEPVAGVDTPVTIFCGGIGNIQCPAGGTCKLDGDYPDASGKCTDVPVSSPSPSPSPGASPSPSPTPRACGGIGGEKGEFACPIGYVCDYSDVPADTADRQGKCVPRQSPKPTSTTSANFYQCTADTDCVSIRADNCGCQAGGKATAINKQYVSQWEEAHPVRNCVAEVSADPTCLGVIPKCSENQCKLVSSQ